MKLLVLDLSTTSTGFATFDMDTNALSEYGSIQPQVSGLHKLKYPYAALSRLLSMTQQVKDLVEKNKPDEIVIEEVNRGINRIAQKSLDALHFFILQHLNGYTVKYVDSNGKKGWRGALGLELSKEDKEFNKKVRTSAKESAKSSAKNFNLQEDQPTTEKTIQPKVIDWKVLAERYVRKSYKLDFNVQERTEEADICDAICLGHAYLHVIRILSGTKTPKKTKIAPERV